MDQTSLSDQCLSTVPMKVNRLIVPTIQAANETLMKF